MIVIYTDGGARNNPGPAGAGAVIFHNDEKVAEISEFLGNRTNNWAEYEAVALALAKVRDMGLAGHETEMRMDSKLVVEQLSGNWRVKEPSLKPQFEKTRELAREFRSIRFVHVRREYNKEADRLANDAMDRGTRRNA